MKLLSSASSLTNECYQLWRCLKKKVNACNQVSILQYQYLRTGWQTLKMSLMILALWYSHIYVISSFSTSRMDLVTCWQKIMTEVTGHHFSDKVIKVWCSYYRALCWDSFLPSCLFWQSQLSYCEKKASRCRQSEKKWILSTTVWIS